MIGLIMLIATCDERGEGKVTKNWKTFIWYLFLKKNDLIICQYKKDDSLGNTWLW